MRKSVFRSDREPDSNQNLIYCFFCHPDLSLNFIAIHLYILSNVVNKQRDKQTNATKTIILSDVITAMHQSYLRNIFQYLPTLQNVSTIFLIMFHFSHIAPKRKFRRVRMSFNNKMSLMGMKRMKVALARAKQQT